MRTSKDSLLAFSLLVLATFATAMAIGVLIALALLPEPMLIGTGLERLQEAGGGRGMALALILLSVLVPLGFHLAFRRRLVRDDRHSATIDRIERDLRDEYSRIKAKDGPGAGNQGPRGR